ncbi:MAG: UvrB/UvrC motif-containing protein [Termitinemataceae bacterium]
MMCDICGKREAIVFIHQVGAGQNTELNLCAECAHEHGINQLGEDVGKALMELMKKFPSPAQTSMHNSSKNKKKLLEKCPTCGISVQEVRKNLRLGCSDCWSWYGDILKKPKKYHGRYSLRVEQELKTKEELERLTLLLQTAVAIEDYEQAAAYRDQIQKLEQKL